MAINNAFTAPPSVPEENQNSGTFEQLVGNALSNVVSVGEDNNYYVNGARAILSIHNQPFGYAFAVSYNIQMASEENWTIDDWTPYEIAPTKISVSGTIGSFHLAGKSPGKTHIHPNVLSFMMHKYISIDIRDRGTNQTIFKTNKAMITGKQQNITAGELSTITLTFKAVGWADDVTPNYPGGYSSDSLSAIQDMVDAVSPFTNSF
jgi:hypothetical protein